MDPRLLRPTGCERGAALQGKGLLHGMPSSPGVAEGPVRVVRNGAEFGTLRSGAVLVAPHTNPTWAPLFQRAARSWWTAAARAHTRLSWRARMGSRP